MDLMTIIGIVGGLGTVYYVMSAGNLVGIFINPLAAVLVIGGTVSSTLIAYPWDVVRHILPSLRYIFLSQKNSEADRQGLIDMITALAEKARRTSIDSLQDDLHTIDNRFMAYGMQMVIDGLEPMVVKENLEKEILYSRQRSHKVSNAFNTMATLSPIFGLLGTLIGIVGILRNLTDPSTMGKAMAVGITATFYGIFLANFVFIPAATKLNEHGENDVVTKELIAEGVLSIQQGDLPSIVRKRLNAFVISHLHRTAETDNA